jgi:polysaccharide biosynthesis protein PelF
MTVAASPTSDPKIDPKVETLPTADHVDVLLILEGTFPWVAGGVSSWVNQIIRGFPELRFGAIFIGSRAEDYGPMRYALPDNLVHLQTLYLFDETHKPVKKPQHAQPGAIEMTRAMHDTFHNNERCPHTHDQFAQLFNEAHADGKISHEMFLYSHESWKYITDAYRAHCTDPSFVDYFWTVRSLHEPFWHLHRAAQASPTARIYHAVSTGYAGILGVLLKHRRPAPFLLSEHGIYVKERKIDLFQAQWLKDNRSTFERDDTQLGYYRQLWIRFFEHLGYVTYQAADDITALYEANRQRQLVDGAPVERTRNIPNGIDIARFAPLRELRARGESGETIVPPILCLIGRVVPIKDVKTYIRAMRTVVAQMPDAEAWIAGPEDEDPAYAQECHDLVAQLGLTDKVKFLGFQKLTDLLAKVGLVVLSSISEALPLVILEGYAAGVPTLATDVGSCRQLVYGLPGEDEALGSSGEVVRIADPDALAQAAISLLSDPERWQAASQAAIARVETYYAQEAMFGRYRYLYYKSFVWQELASPSENS